MAMTLTDRQKTSAPVTREEHQQLVEAFNRSPSLFKLLSTVRTRRMGKGFTIETGRGGDPRGDRAAPADGQGPVRVHLQA